MAQGGPRPSAFYVERMATTRVPATPSPLTAEYARTSLASYGQTDPGVGTTREGDGILLTGLTAVTVSLWPTDGGTLTGGSLLAWLWSPFTQKWSRMPDLDLAVTATVTGPVGYSFSPLSVAGREGWVMNFLASSLTGTTANVLMRVDGFAGARVTQ